MNPQDTQWTLQAGMSRKARRHALLLRHNHRFLSVCLLRILQLLQPREPDEGSISEVFLRFASQHNAARREHKQRHCLPALSPAKYVEGG